MSYDFLNLCRSKAPKEVRDLVYQRTLEPKVLENTIVVEDRETFESYVLAMKGQPFALDTETTSDETKRLQGQARAFEDLLAFYSEEVVEFTSVVRSYTKKALGSEYSAEEKLKLQKDKKAAQEQLKSFKQKAVFHKKALKDCKDPLNPLKGYVGIVQISWGKVNLLLRREFLKRNVDLFTTLLTNAPDFGIYVHNAKFDWKFLTTTFGVKIPSNKCFCTFIAEGLLLCGALVGAEEATGMRRKQLSLKACLSRRFGVDLDKGFQAGVDWDSDLTDGQVCYAITDVIAGYHLGEFQKKLLVDTGMWDAFKLEMQAMATLCEMELEGMTIDYESLQKWKVGLEVHQNELLDILELLVPDDVELNPNSPTQLKKFLKEYAGIEVESTDEAELSNYSDDPFIATLLEYRKVSKVLGTYVEPYLEMAVQREDGSWAVHGEFNQGLLNTGRLSSSNPNLQNVPSRDVISMEIAGEAKEFFLRDYVVPRKNHYMIGGDLSQVEIRVMADIAQDLPLMDACNANEDTHKQVASDCLGIPFEEVTKEQRPTGKVMNLAIPYGKKPFSIASDLGIPIGRAGVFYHNYFVKHPFIKSFMQQSIQEAKDNKFVRLPSGRVRHIPEIDSDIPYIVTKAENRSYNTKIQGTAADGMKLTLVLLREKISEFGLTGLMMPTLTVHDEVICECHETVPEELALGILTSCLKEGTQHFCSDVRIEVGNAECGWSSCVLETWGGLK